MDLKTLKQLEDAKKKLAPLQEKAVERIKNETDICIHNCINDFRSYFESNGFTVNGAGKQFTAKYENATIDLTIDDKARLGAFAVFTLTTPPDFSTTPFEVLLVSVGHSNQSTAIHAGQTTLLNQIEDQISVFEKSLNEPPPIFEFIIRGKQASRDSPVQNLKFQTFRDFLNKTFP